ncbi:MAG: O-antigen ligase family protein [Salinivirgaceae bacterium]
MPSKNWWVYALVILFIAVNGVLIYKEFFLFSILPVALLLVVAAFFSMDKLLLLLVFLVPLSIPLSELIPDLPIDMFLPTEPLLAGLLLLFLIKLFFDKSLPIALVKHPVSIVIYFYLTWMLITTVTSTMPLVSIKFFAAKLWFIAAFFFLATQLFKAQKNFRKYIILYAVALVIVVIYATIRHLKYGIFDEKIAHWSANPFYKDHTSYGAMLAFFIPPLIGVTFFKGYAPRTRFFFAIILLFLIIGIIFSYSRAAWISLIGAFGIWVLIKLRIKFWVIVSGITLVTLVFLLIGSSLLYNLKSNKQDASADLIENVKSISNVSTDASNLERLNRWNCALKMFREKPIFGWGPGTYMFHYAPFQLSYEKTIISTNEGDMGNAHSEYLGPLSEQGFLGTLFFLLILVFTTITGVRAIRNTQSIELRMLGLTSIVGLYTYYFHGILNNFLDTDKASAPFWGFTAILVAIDIYYRQEKTISKQG